MKLKYYFGFCKNKGVYLDSIICADGEVPCKPENFLKWYEDGDLEPSEKFIEHCKAAESPMFAAAFANRQITFKTEDYLENK